jgi:hypothetical protein
MMMEDMNAIDVVFIVRDKFSKSLASLESLLNALESGSAVYIMDAGYPDYILSGFRKLSDQFPGITVVIVANGKFMTPNEALNSVRSLLHAKNVLLIENDIRIDRQNLQAMLHEAESRGCDIVQPTIFEEDGITIHFDPPVSSIADVGDGIEHRLVRNPRPGHERVSGSRRIYHLEKHCLLVRLSALRQIGVMEPFLRTRSHHEMAFRCFRLGLVIWFSANAAVRFLDATLADDDQRLFEWRWDKEIGMSNNDYIQKKWGIANDKSTNKFLSEQGGRLSSGMSLS